MSFYIDDINRELRYRKGNYLYTPSWPEWMQDVYYRCFLCNTLLRAAGFTDNTFLYYRTRTFAERFPSALESLDAIRRVATQRGATMAVLNIPAFTWPGVLTEASAYRFADMNRALAAWARERRVHYHDVLPALVGVDIRQLRIGDTDVHFTDEGHRVVGAELQRLLDVVMDAERSGLPGAR